MIPTSPAAVARAAEQSRRLVKRRALLAAGVAMVPIPGLDWLTDVAVLIKLLPEINQAFGLSEAQISRLAPERRLVVYKVLSAAGVMAVGKVVTQQVVMNLLKAVGVRLTAQQAAKYVPVAGTALSAVLTYSALKYVCEMHIRQCEQVVSQLALPAPGEPGEVIELVDDGPQVEPPDPPDPPPRHRWRPKS